MVELQLNTRSNLIILLFWFFTYRIQRIRGKEYLIRAELMKFRNT
jgi:hypothetical protein